MAEIRLNKLTKQFGIGLARLVDFLNEQGVNVEMNPNAKISDEYLPVIDAKFGEDLKLKKDSEKVTIKLKEIIEMGSKKKVDQEEDIPERTVVIKSGGFNHEIPTPAKSVSNGTDKLIATHHMPQQVTSKTISKSDASEIIQLFSLDNSIGDHVSIDLTNGKTIHGVIVEINTTSVVIEGEDGKKIRLFDKLIGAWENTPNSEVVEEEISVTTIDKDATINVDDIPEANPILEETNDEAQQRMGSILSESKRLIKLLFNELRINPNTLTDTNARIESVDSRFIYATLDDGQEVRISTEYFIGYLSQGAGVGSRVFCRPISKDEGLISNTTIQEFSYADFMRFIIRMCNEKDINSLRHIIKVMWNMPTFSGCEDFLRKIHRAITHPTDKNIEELANLQSIVEDELTLERQFEQSIRNYTEFKDALDDENAIYNIDKNRLLSNLGNIKDLVEQCSNIFTPKYNATIQRVMSTSMVADVDGIKVRVFYQHIIDKELLISIRNNPDIQHNVVLHTYFNKKKGELRALTMFTPCPLIRLYDIIVEYVNEGNYYYAKKALDALIVELQDHLNNRECKLVKNVLAYIKQTRNSSEQPQIPNIAIIFSEKREMFSEESKRIHREVITKVDVLRANGNDSEALKYLDGYIKSDKLLPKHISALLLRKAQILATLEDRQMAIDAYKEVIKYDESIGKSELNLSHLYTELARIQSQVPELRQDAIGSVEKALKYHYNKIAQNLLDSITSESTTSGIEHKDTLMISSDEGSSLHIASRMLEVDIKEHQFTDKHIIENNGKPTPAIAQNIFDEANKTADVENYPLFLEAAKAYSELKIGSYDYLSYAKAVASYARLKGNFLLRKFRKDILGSHTIDSRALTLLKDSAQSYYIESLSFWSYISDEDGEHEEDENPFSEESVKDSASNSWETIVQEILANYLRLDLALYYYNMSSSSAHLTSFFDASFKELFNNCIRSGSAELEKIAFTTVIKIGSFSYAIWNDVVRMGGVACLYDSFNEPQKTCRIFNYINEIEGTKISTTLRPSEFLREAFKLHTETMEALEKKTELILREPLSPYEIERLFALWTSIEPFNRLFCQTESESKKRIDDILKTLRPYANRSDQERSDLLLQARDIIESEIAFINSNTTYYGRTLFFPLLTKWKTEIIALQKEKMASKLPCLSVMPDPPYIITKNDKKTINLLIKNEGESTAEGFQLLANISSINADEQYVIERTISTDLPINQKVSLIIELNNELQANDKAIDLRVRLKPLYLSNYIEGSEFSFTIEEEPATPLEFEDVIWDDGPVTPQNLFFGRRELINKLLRHYTSVQKNKPYILYGLTRTGKSSIIKFLGEEITGKSVISNGQKLTILHFSMDLDKADNREDAKEIWSYFIKSCLYNKLEEYAVNYSIKLANFVPRVNPKAADFEEFLVNLRKEGYYPFITMDEFSYLKNLMQLPKQRLRPAFLHELRQYSFNGLASFMYVGTYDIKDLITSKEYGITGQLTHCIDYQLNEIDEVSARELMDVLGDKLRFTDDAKDLISFLSGNVPYFIQIICKNCGFYAVEHKRGHIGFPELEQVMDVLLGEIDEDDDSELKKLTINPFEDNQYSATDPIEVHAVISSISYLNKDNKHNPRGIGIGELEKLWADYGVKDYRPRIGEAIALLMEKKILEQYEDEGVPVYRIVVDLFRRWWGIQYPDISLALSPLLKKK